MNDQSNLPATRGNNQLAPVDRLKNNLSSRADEFKMVLPSHIGVDKFQRTVATAALSNPKLLECDRQSLLLASLKLAQDGLLPDGREAALVPFRTSYKDGNEWREKWLVQPMPMVYGLRKKILQSGEVISLQVGVVYAAEVQGGNFIYEIGIDPPIRHRPKLDMVEEEMSDDAIVAAYSIALIKNGDSDPIWSVEVMRRFEIDKVRQMSQTGALGQVVKFGQKKGQPVAPKGPWVDWYAEMAKKTVLRRHSKVLPMSGDILDTLLREDEERAADGAAALLASPGGESVRLPPPEDAEEEQHDTETGEVVENKPGMTEVDEETARELDAGGESDGEEGPSATYVGMLNPAEAQHADVKAGESWYSPDTGATKYAHVTPKGIRWYLEPPKPEAEGQGNSDAADPHAGKPYEEKRAEILDILKSASDIDAVKFAENMLTRYVDQFPDKVAQELEDRIDETRDRVADEVGQE